MYLCLFYPENFLYKIKKIFTLINNIMDDYTNFEIKDSKFGKGLFYVGDVQIAKGETVIFEKPFFEVDNVIGVLTDCAAMSFKSLELDINDDIYKKLQEFKVGYPSKEFRENVLETYKDELKFLSDHFTAKFFRMGHM